MSIPKVFFYVLSVCLLAGLASAQATGRLTGSVVDSTGAIVPGAGMSLMLPDGSRAVLIAQSTTGGLFAMIGVPAGTYNLIVDATGFRKHTERGVVVAPGKETSLNAIKLEIGSVTETVEVSNTEVTVQTTNAEVSLSITRKQVQALPVLDRSPQAFVVTQAGVNDGRGDPTINGQRTTFTNVTLDGINIQDNYVRTNAVNYSPFMLLLDQVAEMTVATSNTSSGMGAGASQVSFVTPSGGNRYRGNVLWQNHNNFFASNTWFNNQAGIQRPFLNQNQAGGSIGGPIIKDKLLFYVNYEALRVSEQAAANRSVLTADARQGIFTYRNTQGAVQKVNVLQAAGVSADAGTRALIDQVPGPDKINNFRTGDSSASLLRNTAGYAFNIRSNRRQDHVTAKLDYNFSTAHTFSGTYIWSNDLIDRPDVSNDFSTIPKVTNDDFSELFSIGWRWNPGARITNELRGGRSYAPVIFATSETFPSQILGVAGALFANPLNTFRASGRNPTTYNLADNAAYISGKHNIQFGFHSQSVVVEVFGDAGITPTYTLGIGTGNPGLTTVHLPGAAAADITTANNLLANLAGYVASYAQTFNVTSRNSGFVSGAGSKRNWLMTNYAGYVTDSWKISPRLTANLGVRYEYYTRIDERDGLALLPRLMNGNVDATLLSNATIDFAGSSVDRPFYNADRNNWAPNVGLAWDVTGRGRTVVRSGYSINFVNDESVGSMAGVAGNAGLAQGVSATGLTARISTGIPRIATPAFAVPRTFQDSYALSTLSDFRAPDPNLRNPYVQQWNFGIQQEYRGILFDVRYVGNHGTKLFRQIDLNQVLIRENGFLDDFLRAQSNGNLARARSGVFDPAYNAAIPGSQQLPVFARLPNGGSLTGATNRTLIDEGRVGELANSYQTARTNGPLNFFPNPFAQVSRVMSNYSNSSYNAFQFDARTGKLRGLTFQGNYTYSKVLSDAQAGSENAFQARNEAFLDRFNPQIERARAPFDLTHVIKGNFIYEIPAGKGHRFNAPRLGRVLGGWQISGIFVRQSGDPFSILSGRGTLNRNGQSGSNTVNSNLTLSQLHDVFQFRQTSTGPYFAAASMLGADGRAVAADGFAPFNGQVFFQPGAGTLGALQRRLLSGPWVWNMDFALLKRTTFGERQTITMRMDSGNIFNHPSWAVGNQTVTATNFGQITGTYYGRRVLQFSLKYEF